MRSLTLLAVTLLTSQIAFAGATVDRMPSVNIGTAEATLVGNKDHLSVSGRATGLIPGNVYTVWWIVVDSSEFVVVNATGGIANSAGEYGFGGALPTGSYDADLPGFRGGLEVSVSRVLCDVPPLEVHGSDTRMTGQCSGIT